MINLNYAVSGRFKLVSHKTDINGDPIPGSEVERTGWINNLITNRGMNSLGDTDAFGYFMRGCAVGSGSTAPASSDTSLTSRIANAIPISGSHGRDLAASPNYVWFIKTYRFGAGVATGNISEVGLVAGAGDSAGSGGALHPSTPISTHALVLDGGGLPTTVTVLSDEVLDVVYEVRLSIPGADVAGTVVIGGVTHDYTVRPLNINISPDFNSGGWGAYSYNGQIEALPGFRQGAGYGENAIWCGAAAEITTQVGAAPAGVKVAGNNAGMTLTSGGYISDSHNRDCTQSFSLGSDGTYANQPGGIGVHSFAFLNHSFQVNLTPHVMKTNAQLYSLTMRVSWARG